MGEGPVRRRCWREGNLVLQTALPSLESRTCAHSPTVLACVPGGVLTGGQCLPFWGLQSEGELTKLDNHRNRGVTAVSRIYKLRGGEAFRAKGREGLR